MKFIESEEFKKEFKKLAKKYRTLGSDLETVKKVIKSQPISEKSKHSAILHARDEKYIVKMRMACRALKDSDLRIVYYYDGEDIEIIFIEIYFKGEKEREDLERVKFYKGKYLDKI